jgi:hypothetical protein
MSVTCGQIESAASRTRPALRGSRPESQDIGVDRKLSAVTGEDADPAVPDIVGVACNGADGLGGTRRLVKDGRLEVREGEGVEKDGLGDGSHREHREELPELGAALRHSVGLPADEVDRGDRRGTQQACGSAEVRRREEGHGVREGGDRSRMRSRMRLVSRRILTGTCP